MFPLIAIATFFILGIAFFAIGKDDFGIKRVTEVSNDTFDNRMDPEKEKLAPKYESFGGKELESSYSSAEYSSGDIKTY